MRFSLAALGAIFFLCFAVWTGSAFWREQRVQSTLRPPPLSEQEVAPRDAGATLDALRMLPASPLSGAEPKIELFEQLSASAAALTDPAQKGAVYCEALAALEDAMRIRPKDSALLINWANTRQLLGTGFECPRDSSNSDFGPVVEAALDNDPTNVAVLFAGAHIYDWSRRGAQVHDLLNKVLSLSTSLAPGQIAFILSKLDGPGAVQAVVPQRFPQIATWSHLLKGRRPDIFEQSALVLEAMQIHAIRSAVREHERRAVPLDLLPTRLLSLYHATASSRVRRVLDAAFAATHGATPALAEHLRNRGGLDEAPVVPAAMASDTRPLHSAVVGWGDKDEICLDDFFSTIAFFLPDGEPPQLIELSSERGKAELPSGALKLYVSVDNENWSELQGNVDIAQLELGSRNLIAIRPHSSYFRYWKITLSSASRPRRFCGGLDTLLTVYRHATKDVA